MADSEDEGGCLSWVFWGGVIGFGIIFPIIGGVIFAVAWFVGFVVIEMFSDDGSAVAQVDEQAFNEYLGGLMQLTLYIASIDGHADQSEINIIKNLGSELANATENEDLRNARKSKMNESLGSAKSMINSGQHQSLFNSATSKLLKVSDPELLFVAYEKCLEVVSADGKADLAELSALNQIERAFSLNRVEAKKMRDNALVGLSVDHSGGADALLEITSNMSKDQIKRHLRQLFAKHNARINHDNREIREVAKRQLDIVAEAKTRHNV